ncbi:MAG: hypothetical protein KIS96_04085 [Bauldia sp.]|nr:hypothetical protein [Bauldia sp.]
MAPISFRSLLLALAAVPLLPLAALAAMGLWAEEPHVGVRLIASIDDTGVPRAAIEIALDPGWKTYWRVPGEGGLAPTFDFSGSVNVASATVGFPAPRRYDDGVSITNVYEDRVILPVAVEPAVGGAPITLRVAMELGVCETICIPMRLEAEVALAPNDFDPQVASIIQLAAARLPGPPRERVFAVDRLVRLGEGALVGFTATLTAPRPQAELFVEAPEGWYPMTAYRIAAHGDRVTFAFMLERLEDDAVLVGEALRLTVASGREAIEQTLVVE